jgi:hypothetical protein
MLSESKPLTDDAEGASRATNQASGYDEVSINKMMRRHFGVSPIWLKR